jgi:ABC-type nitrate/sulfonate/bicarbonate transport system ATPase subunit
MGEVTFPISGASSRAPVIGFVPQQDILPATLTVREAILFAARLRLPESIPFSEQLARVDDVIEKLGLTRVADVRIGDGEKRGISGGEMRRVSIGLELVAEPDVLILDEPTSGLDSVSASQVARVLHGLAHNKQNPTAVIASIHQPRSAASFSCIGLTLTYFSAPNFIRHSTKYYCFRMDARCTRGPAAWLPPHTSLPRVSTTKKVITSQTICWISLVTHLCRSSIP